LRNAFELLVAVTLSAQTTDIAVNKVTKSLFIKYPDAKALSKARQSSVEKILSTIGMFRMKARNIIALSKILIEKYGGDVPKDFEKLTELPGVGRKTANVVLSIYFSEQRMPVDTHVFRVANRIGFAHKDNVEKTEEELMRTLPKTEWNNMHNAMIWHGRKVCKARKPDCKNCIIKDYCKMSRKKTS
jgi:endonuclease-3